MNNKERCEGCKNNYYNKPGNSTAGECWMLKSATVVERVRVGIWQEPPYADKPQKTLSCHRPDNGTTWLTRDDCRVVKT